MKIGTIGYANNSGLGVMLKFFRKHLEIDSQLVIDWKAKGINLEDLSCKHVVTSKEYPSIETLEEFISFKPDVVLIIEYPFCWDYLRILKEKGIKIVYIPMLDSVGLNVLEICKDFVDLWLCVTKHSYKLIQLKGWKCFYLPYPVDTDYFGFDDVNKYGKRLWGGNLTFLHNAGYCGVVPRKGTDLVLKAYLLLKTKIPHARLILNSQVPLNIKEKHVEFFKYWKVELDKIWGLNCVNIDIDTRIINTKNLCDLYKEGDIYLAPSRKEGLGLPIYEAMACGFPVITTNAPPMNEVVTDKRLLVKQQEQEPDLDDLVLKMEFAVSTNLNDVSRRNRKIIEENFSWKVLKSQYLNVFQKVFNGE